MTLDRPRATRIRSATGSPAAPAITPLDILAYVIMVFTFILFPIALMTGFLLS